MNLWVGTDPVFECEVDLICFSQVLVKKGLYEAVEQCMEIKKSKVPETVVRTLVQSEIDWTRVMDLCTVDEEKILKVQALPVKYEGMKVHKVKNVRIGDGVNAKLVMLERSGEEVMLVHSLYVDLEDFILQWIANRSTKHSSMGGSE